MIANSLALRIKLLTSLSPEKKTLERKYNKKLPCQSCSTNQSPHIKKTHTF